MFRYRPSGTFGSCGTQRTRPKGRRRRVHPKRPRAPRTIRFQQHTPSLQMPNLRPAPHHPTPAYASSQRHRMPILPRPQDRHRPGHTANARQRVRTNRTLPRVNVAVEGPLRHNGPSRATNPGTRQPNRALVLRVQSSPDERSTLQRPTGHLTGNAALRHLD